MPICACPSLDRLKKKSIITIIYNSNNQKQSAQHSTPVWKKTPSHYCLDRHIHIRMILKPGAILAIFSLQLRLDSAPGFLLRIPSCRDCSLKIRCFDNSLPSSTSSSLLAAGRRYGPPLDDFGGDFRGKTTDDFEQQKKKFRNLIDQILSVTKAEHIPSLLTKNTKLLLSLEGETAVEIVESILEEASQNGGEEESTRVAEAVDMILNFTEEFVNQSKNMDDYNKKLLGRIIRTMADKEGSERDREERLDELILKEKENFSRGFLRHLDSECDRIASAPKVTPESARLQEILMVIKTRILEELGKDIGEGALVLGQLIAYEDKNERMAVLEAGLTVRGVPFAIELASLTQEALDGFKNVPSVDQTLVSRVEEIDQAVKKYIEENSEFQ